MRILIVCFLCLPGPILAQPVCPGTPFGCAVEDAIERGHQQLAAAEGDTGQIGDSTEHNAQAASVIMQRRWFAWRDRFRGYDGLTPTDQQRVTRLLRRLIETQPALMDPNAADPLNPDSWRAIGHALEALSTYLATGGPNAFAAPVTANEAIVHGILALHAIAPVAGWQLDGPTRRTSEIALAMVDGLAAAENIIFGAGDNLPGAEVWLTAQTLGDGSVAGAPWPTLAGIQMRRRMQQPAGAPRVQQALTWLLSHDGALDADAYAAHQLWVSALNLCEDDGLGGQVYTSSFAYLDPADFGYPEEGAGAYFDAAVDLLAWQTPAGRWGLGVDGAPQSADPWRSHLRALSTLQSYRIQYFPDTDDDGLINPEDNCPRHPNPTQADEDEDRIGDLCDNCTHTINRDQADRDADGVGDVCDNCPDYPNPAQRDANQDGIGDPCDPAFEPDADMFDGGPLDSGSLDADPPDAPLNDAESPDLAADASDPIDAGPPKADAMQAPDPPAPPADGERRARRRDDCAQSPGAPGGTGLIGVLALGWFLRRRA